MTRTARSVSNEREQMHAGRRFGDVVVGAAADHELTWFFNEAESAMELPSVQGQLLAERRPGSPEALLAGAEAIHAGRKIWERLLAVGARDEFVLQALYTARRWPRAIERKLFHLSGVVESLPAVRAQHLFERGRKLTAAATTTAWLEEIVEQRAAEAVAWRDDAARACARALSAYQHVRGEGPSVAPEEDDR